MIAKRMRYSTKKTIDEQIKHITTLNKKTLEAVETEITTSNNESRQSTIQILGVFAAFLAFVTISLGAIKVAHNILQFVVFSITFMLSLSLFVVCLKHTFRHDSNRSGIAANCLKSRLKKHAVSILAVLGWIIILGLCSKFLNEHLFYITEPEKVEKKLKILETEFVEQKDSIQRELNLLCEQLQRSPNPPD
ncbi:MAG: DUF805 domain-containing protein [Tannerellaceae bacterium]|nr:DUF805 domain-containing protein [Tannerellaceae bacterium]